MNATAERAIIVVMKGGDKDEYQNDKAGMAFVDSEDGKRQFFRLTSITTYLHHTIVLVTIMAIAHSNPQYFKHWSWGNFWLKPDGNDFYWAFGVTLLMGFYSMILSLYLAENVTKVEVGKLKL